MSYSNYLEDKINDAVCNNVALQVAQAYVKLHTGDPGEDGTSNAAVETTRKAQSFGASSAGTALSDADISWGNYNAGGAGNTETITHVSMWDASSAGNCLGSGALTQSKVVNNGDTFTIASGDLSFTSA